MDEYLHIAPLSSPTNTSPIAFTYRAVGVAPPLDVANVVTTAPAVIRRTAPFMTRSRTKTSPFGATTGVDTFSKEAAVPVPSTLAHEPEPAQVVTSPAAEIRRTRVESATIRSPLDAVAIPPMLKNSAVNAGPSRYPMLPPANVVTSSPTEIRRIRDGWLTKTSPAVLRVRRYGYSNCAVPIGPSTVAFDPVPANVETTSAGPDGGVEGDGCADPFHCTTTKALPPLPSPRPTPVTYWVSVAPPGAAPEPASTAESVTSDPATYDDPPPPPLSQQPPPPPNHPAPPRPPCPPLNAEPPPPVKADPGVRSPRLQPGVTPPPAVCVPPPPPPDPTPSEPVDPPPAPPAVLTPALPPPAAISRAPARFVTPVKMPENPPGPAAPTTTRTVAPGVTVRLART